MTVSGEVLLILAGHFRRRLLLRWIFECTSFC